MRNLLMGLRGRALTAWLLVFAPLETAMIWWRIDAAPFAWICLIWAAVTIALCAASLRPVSRLVWSCVAAICLALGLVDGALYLGKARNLYLLPKGVQFVGDLARPNYFIQMPTPGLGYQPRPGMQITAIKQNGPQTIYAVRYSVGPDGLRIAPAAQAHPLGCVLMFGDSMAWGEGVNDEETAAYRIGQLTAGAIKVTNFAFTGYSAHQMLWQVRSGMVKKVAACDPALPVLAIYQTLPNNVGRVAGLRGWDEYGPRYVLDSDGQPQYVGSFAAGDYILHDHVFIRGVWAHTLSRINLYSRIWGRDRKTDAFDVLRFAAIVKAAQGGLHELFPHLKFLVVVWPEPSASDLDPQSDTTALIRMLNQQHIDTLDINDVLPEYRTMPDTTGIPGDGHPTAATHMAIARYLAPLAKEFASANVTSSIASTQSTIQEN